FIIWNTFTMVVTQRSREIALLRAVGATRRQVLRSLMLEAVLLGSGASLLGIGLGVGVAKGLGWLMDVMGFALPSTSLQLETRTVVVALAVGTLTTVVAALVPARRATKVLPVEALRQSTPGADGSAKRRGIVGLVTTAAGVSGVLSSLYGSAPRSVFALGLVAVVAGVLIALPLAVGPLASLIGAPLRLRGLPGEIAEQNAKRNPRRTSSTAAALMIGLALVVSMGVFASSLKASYADVLGDQMDADLFVKASSVQGPGFSPDVVEAVRQVPGVDAVSPTGWGEARFAGETSSFSSVDPGTAEDVLEIGVSQGSIADLSGDAIMVSRSAAQAHGWKLGDVVTTEFPATGKHRLAVVAIYGGKGWVADDFVLSVAQQKAFAGPQLLTAALVQVTAGSEISTVEGAVAKALAGHPDARVMDQDEFEKVAGGAINSLLAFVTVMLLLTVLIALLGIINTLALSVFERTRELGLLRAVGMTRGQVRAMVRWESVVISLIGALTGAGLGIGIGLALAQSLRGEGITAISIPTAQVVMYVGLAAIAGVLAALGPARSAARIDVLRAVVSD
ncbi:MAG TPA: FtsX-like permease family protein, partial [Propionibacteriaceae bacterium]